MKKRTISLLLALCMVFSMAMPAIAAEPNSSAIDPTASMQETTAMPEEVTTPEDIAPTLIETEAEPISEESDTPEEVVVSAEEASAPEEADVLPEEAADVPTTVAAQSTAAPKIPGYTQVTSTSLNTNQYYLIVALDSNNRAYALYPDPLGLNASAGDAISTSTAPEGTFVGELRITDQNVSATHMKDNQSIDMNDLRFTVEKSGSSYAFVGSNYNYIALNDHLLSKAPVNLSLSMGNNGAVTLKNTSTNRILDFNKRGDDKQFKNGNTTFNTNFWAPYNSTRFSIYLYTQDNAVVPPSANKGELRATIRRAEEAMSSRLYSDETKATLRSALDAAKAEDSNPNATAETIETATQNLVDAMQAMKPIASMIADHAPANGTTEGQPFPVGMAGSQTFRIPAITTLKDGSLAAAIDARWDKSPDGDNIDTLFSISRDNGQTWEYTFPNFFNDSVNKMDNLSTAFLDPVMVQGNDGTIYLMTDLFPAGHYILSVDNATGYEMIDGVLRMVLYTTPNKGQTSSNYVYYVGDFSTAKGEDKAFAPVIDKNDHNRIAYYVDDHYYLYTADKVPMYCPQLGSDKYVEQNVFFYNAELHVRNATYLWLVTSKDNGKTWSAPTIMNPLVRPDPETHKTHRFYGVGPGAGLALKDGTVMLTCYINDASTQEKSSFIYTRDNGKTWKRSQTATTGNDWSSESTLVQINDTTVRQFCRDGYNVLRYTDHEWNGTEWVRKGNPVALDNVPKTEYNQLSAIRYSKPINGKPAILVSTATMPGRHRTRGMIYTFTLNDDNSMELIGSYQITKAGTSKEEPGVVYGYSSLTELSDGSIGLLYEETFKNSKYINLPIEKLAPGAIVDGKRNVEVPLYGTYEDTFAPVPTEEDLKNLDTSIVTAEIKGDKVIFTGVGEGTTTFTSNGITTTIKVVSTYPTKPVEIPCDGEFSIGVGANPNILNNSGNITTTLDPIVVTGGQGATGTDKNFTGNPEALATALYTFHQDGEQFQVSAPAADGTMTWLDPSAATGFPFSTQPASVQFVPHGENTFYLLNGDSRYLFFWPNKANQYSYDAVSKTQGFESGCSFKLYRPAAQGEKASTEIPGYVLVNQPEDNGKYLIVSEVNGNRFVMRPSADTANRYSHVLMVKPDLEQVPTTIANTLTFRPEKHAGSANILVDGTVYQVSIKHQLTRVERVEPTSTTEGNILYWHCDVCNQNFLDEAGTQLAADVVLPIPLTPLDPSTPVPDEKPDEKPDVPATPDKPTTPNEPSQPDTTPNGDSNTTSADKPAKNPATGDSAELGIWLAVFVLAGAGVGVTVYQKKRKHQS